MIVKNIEAIVVSVPLVAPIRWSMGALASTTRTIVKLETDEGIVGYGEAPEAAPKSIIDGSLRHLVEGSNLFGIEKLLAKCGISHRHHQFLGYQTQLRAVAAVEMAHWDAIGKALGRPVCDLLGGRFREKVAFTGYVYPRHKAKGGEGGEATPEQLARYSKNAIRKFGYETLEFKLGVFPPKTDLELVETVRSEVGPDKGLRLDPNCAWSPETSVKMLNQLLKYDVSYVEEPCYGLKALARVKTDTSIPISTHAQFMIPEIVALDAADAIAADPHECGGIQMIRKIVATAEIHNLGIWLHSNAELGISTAAYTHICASSPNMIHPNQGTYEHLSDDVIKGGKLAIRGGCIEVPTQAGLGVELDASKVRRYHKLYASGHEGGFSSSSDPKIPEWIGLATKW